MNKALRIWSGASVIGGWFLGAANLSYAQTVCQDARLTASDDGVFENFGRAVAVSGDTALIGADWDRELGTEAGAAYVFRRDPDKSGTWVEMQKLLASDQQPGDEFGFAVAIDGDTALISGLQHIHEGAPGTSAVYVFRYNGSSWMETQELLASAGTWGDGFSFSVSLSGDLAVIGAPSDDDAGTNFGASYVFRYDSKSETWVEEQKLLPPQRRVGVRRLGGGLGQHRRDRRTHARQRRGDFRLRLRLSLQRLNLG